MLINWNNCDDYWARAVNDDVDDDDAVIAAGLDAFVDDID